MPAEVEQVTADEYETLAGLRYSLRQFLRFSEEAARSFGVTPQQHQALLAIKGFGGRASMTVGELSERLQIRHQSAVGLADRLVAKGLVERKTGQTDRRRVCLSITRRSETILEKLSAAHKEQLRRVGPQIETFLRRLRGQEEAQ